MRRNNYYYFYYYYTKDMQIRNWILLNVYNNSSIHPPIFSKCVIQVSVVVETVPVPGTLGVKWACTSDMTGCLFVARHHAH